MTERLAYGQCRRCGAYADSPTYKCESCGTNYVELFATPVALDSAGASGASQPLQSSSIRSQEVESVGDRLVSVAVCLTVALVAAVPAVLLFSVAVITWYFTCGDNPSTSCAPHFSGAWFLLLICAALAAAAALVVVVSLLLALLQVGFVLKRFWPGHSR